MPAVASGFPIGARRRGMAEVLMIVAMAGILAVLVYLGARL